MCLYLRFFKHVHLLSFHSVIPTFSVFRARADTNQIILLEKWKSHLTVCDPMNYTAHGILQTRILGWVAFSFFRRSSQPRIELRSPALQAGSLLAEPQGKPKNTGVGSLSLLQLIFPTHPGIQLGSPALQEDSLPTELSREPSFILLKS